VNAKIARPAAGKAGAGCFGKLLWAGGALLALQASSASAATFDWSYAGPGVSGSGTFTANFVGADTYGLTAITGTANGQTILGLDSYDGPDNVVFSPSPPDVAVDTLGFSFSVGAAGSYNLFEDDGLYTPGPPYGCGTEYCLLGPGTAGAGDPLVALTSFTLTPVPEPATWAIMLVGFGGLGAAMRAARRGRTAIA